MQVQKIHEVRMSALINAINLAKNQAEVPIGCAIYDSNNNLTTTEFNEVEKNIDSTSHAEILAIKKVCKINSHPNLQGYSLYVTLEPCLMCLGAIQHSNIEKIVFGAYSDKSQEITSFLDLFRQNNPKIEIIGGVLEKECKNLLSNWFKYIR